MNVVFGATGRIGGAAAAELRRRGLAVRAAVRDLARGEHLAQSGCELARAELGDATSVERAMRGATGVLVICPLSARANDVLADAQRIIDRLGEAVDAARPSHVVAISDYGAHHASGTGITTIFRRLEDRLQRCDVAVTFLRSAEHMQNWARQVPFAKGHGELPSLHHPVTRPFPTVSAPDVGVVAADVLASLAPASGRSILHVEGPRRYSATDIAEVVARLAGRPVVARALPREGWESALGAAGLGRDYARLVTELQDAHNAGRIDVEPGGQVRRGATGLADALRALVTPG